jgi:5-oxoprolinase (ATP-hydrolysing)
MFKKKNMNNILWLHEEGIVIDVFIINILKGARQIDQNLADLRAQVAANTTGVKELQKIIQQFGLPIIQAYIPHLQDNTEA